MNPPLTHYQFYHSIKVYLLLLWNSKLILIKTNVRLYSLGGVQCPHLFYRGQNTCYRVVRIQATWPEALVGFQCLLWLFIIGKSVT